MTPIQFGPIKQPFTPLTTDTICLSISFPNSPASANPAEIIMTALVFFCVVRMVMVSKQYLAGIESIAKSVSGISFTEE